MAMPERRRGAGSEMYQSYYGLERAPFDPAPQTDDLFETPTHNEALAALVYGILENKGFVALSGEVGVGKTTVLRRALHYAGVADAKLILVEIANPALGPAALAARLHRALNLEFDVAAGIDLEPLRAALGTLAADGWRLLLVIDEAQSLPEATLEFLRILSNLNGGGRALVQIVLSGQPELDAILDGTAQRALRQRIAVRARIEPLSRRQVVGYLRFRLERAGAAPGAVMTAGAMRLIAARSAGFLRRVNILADNALLAGFGADRRPIGRRIVARAAATLDERPRRRGWLIGARVGVPAAAVLGAAILGWTAVPPSPGRSAAPLTSLSPVQLAAVPAPAAAPSPPPAVEAAPVAAAPIAASPPDDDAAPPPARATPSQPVADGAPAPAEPSHMITHRVVRGDTLTTILRQHALAADAPTLARLREINPGLTDLDRVLVGQDIRLPDDDAAGAHLSLR